MSILFRLSLWVAGVALLIGCGKKNPPPEYRLSAEQLAWQPYQAGQELRFGRANSAQVRTYRITEIKDQMKSQVRYASLRVWPYCQRITVMAQRTDSIYYFYPDSRNRNDSIPRISPLLDMELALSEDDSLRLHVSCDWQHYFYFPSVPVQEVIEQRPIVNEPSWQARLLPDIRLGSRSYGPTLELKIQYSTPTLPRIKVVRKVYFAKGAGVVGFEEDGTGLWYLL